ncbi:competence/damage-inducible protein A [Crateriforma spongiae]|uniref:competence/damage-inducible protein A n=1 Tax=Crateriforma spongiae TaxID=2724528 RepID=UPI001447D489|nr:CinA family nicotinamide mononucleotide deamidase-related protein [Crateriforma spongiae]
MSHLNAEVISIGDEMTSGARLDTNAQWISRRLGELGVTVDFHTTVGDSLQDNIDVFAAAVQRADTIVCTGGLGPTQDDLTRQAMADLVGQPLELRESSLQHIESMFARRGREMPQRNRLQAMFPPSADEIVNPQGTAPGVDLAVDREGRIPSRIFALPGVPAEMKTMFDQTVAPRIAAMAGGDTVIRHHVMRFFGTGESDMEQQLGDMIARDRQPRVGITVSAATISLRITATGSSQEQCDEAIRETEAEIMRRVGHYYFGSGENFEQHHAVDQMLRSTGQSLLVIEFGFAAPLGDWFAALGETPAYRGGLSLAVTDDVIKLAEGDDWVASARTLAHRFGATHVLAVDRYPSLELHDDRPLPAADVRIIVLSGEDGYQEKMVTLGGHPSIVQPRFAKAALAFLRSTLSATS